MNKNNNKQLADETNPTFLKYADLHLHTTASDGRFTPHKMIQLAKDAGLSAVAITDHDSVNGISEALDAGMKLNIEVIPGIELSCIEGKKEVHVLGYFIDSTCKSLNDVLSQMILARDNRAVQMVQKLNDIGIHISLDRVRELSGNEFMGRPHIAQAMIEKGYIKEHSEAFTAEYIGSNGRAYVERFKVDVKRAIQLIHKACGVAVIAHPGYLSDRSTLGEEEIKQYVSYGLDGVEVFYSKHELQQIDYYKRIAQKYNLVLTGGSDCHGRKDVKIGRIRLPYMYVESLKEQIEG